MEREANYLAVGTFVLLVLAMAVLFVYWYSAAGRRGNYQPYEIYFDGSVSGLAVGAPVRYLGVDVGSVQSIGIDPRSPNRVQVDVQISRSAPISPDTVAQLGLEGVTGVLFIDLRRRPPQAATILAGVPGRKYPVIDSMRSNLDVLVSNLPALAGRLNDVLQRASRLLSDSNLAAAEHISGHLDEASAALPRTLEDIDGLVTQMQAAVRDARQVLGDVRGATHTAAGDVAATARQLHVASDNLARSSARLDQLLAASSGPLSDLVRQGVPQLEALLASSRAAARQIEELAQSLRENPSSLLYQPRRAGVALPP